MDKEAPAETDIIATCPSGERDAGSTTDHQAPTAVNTEFRLLFGALYHDACERAYARRHRGLTACNLILGSGAAVAISAQHPAFAQGMALAVAVIGAVQLVWDFGGVARDHAILRQKFYGLLADHQRGQSEKDILADMTVLFGHEPPMQEWARKRAHNTAGKSVFGENFERA